MNEPRDEFLRLIAAAYAPPPLTAADKARFAMGVRARVEEHPGWRVAALAGAAMAAAIGAAVAVLPVLPGGDDGIQPPSFATPTANELGVSWEEEVLYSPEWVSESSDWLDDELVPESYAAAMVLLDS